MREPKDMLDALRRAAEQRVRNAHRGLEEANVNLHAAERESRHANAALDAFEPQTGTHQND